MLLQINKSEETHRELLSDEDCIARIVYCLQNGSIAIIPTDTVYGLACIAGNIDSLSRLYLIKHRSTEKKTALFFADKDSIAKYVIITKCAQVIIDNFLPGPITLILKIREDRQYSFFNRFTTENNTVAIRLVKNHVINRIIQNLDTPIAVTSCNLSGSIAPSKFVDIDPEIINHVDICLSSDLSHADNGQSSTIVDATNEHTIKIIREGPISETMLRNEMHQIP